MGSQPRHLTILSFVVSLLAIGLECYASAEECDYKTCGALMARDASASWAVSGQHDYSPDTKRACAEFNACVRRVKNNSSGRASTAPLAGSSSLRSSSTTAVNPGPANKQAKDVQAGGPPPAAPVTVGNPSATIGSTLRASCGPDVQRLCAGARRESEVLQCLDSQRTELSTTCSLYFQKLGPRPTAQKNAQNKKPPSSPPTRPIPAEVNAPNKQPRPPSPTTPTATEQNGTSKPPLTPAIETIPFPD
jgi:hypothetical protein